MNDVSGRSTKGSNKYLCYILLVCYLLQVNQKSNMWQKHWLIKVANVSKGPLKLHFHHQWLETLEELPPSSGRSAFKKYKNIGGGVCGTEHLWLVEYSQHLTSVAIFKNLQLQISLFLFIVIHYVNMKSQKKAWNRWTTDKCKTDV